MLTLRLTRDECLTFCSLQTSSVEEQLVQPLPARMDFYWDWAGHSEPPRQPGTRRDRSACGSRPTAATPLLMSDGLCIPNRPEGRPIQNPEKSRESHQLRRIVPC